MISITIRDTQECLVEGIRHDRHALIVLGKKEGVHTAKEFNIN